ncbi:hypothetical protein UCRNP2_6665 [Neofusicoccum parvum UCRNP2]|uniref:Uncharacterized protein n=1 Tax=Botryosphaeria parva (strain UCR-NP2) TaxID=1287680 RepID=R1EFR4_BOTPV|nr:hypothetical protein UCRNP2_6665 [Neofusicoccum parvum UCRNP2]
MLCTSTTLAKLGHKLGHKLGIMSHQPAPSPSPSPFLALPRELRNQIYAEAIISCVAVENALEDPRATARPQLSTVTHNVKPPLTKALCIRLRLWHEEPKAIRAGSPAALLLVSHQISAEFSDELFRHAQLVGHYNAHAHNDIFDYDIVALVGAPAAPAVGIEDYSIHLKTLLPLHRLRHWEVQFDIHSYKPAKFELRTGQSETYMRCVDAVLRQLPGVEELTLRLMVADWKLCTRYHHALSSTCKRYLAPSEFMAARIVHRRGLKVFKKACTVGFGRDCEPSTARQVFPLMERVEHWDEEVGAMRVVSDVNNDLRYCKFYTMSKGYGYYWVEKQYQPYDKFGPAKSYQATLDAVMHGYRLWVMKGKPEWNDTEEHRMITRELGLDAMGSFSQQVYREMAKHVGVRLGY